MAALDAVGDYEADPTVTLEDVPQDIVLKTLKVSCACVAVLVFVCVCVCARARALARRRYVFVRICICIFGILLVCNCTATRYVAHKFESGWEVGVIKAFNKKGPHAGKFSVKYKDDPNWWTHSLLREGYGTDKYWVLLGLPSRDSA
jgi:hypothetical protein